MQVFASDIAAKFTPTRSLLAVFSLVFLGGAALSPAYAVPFTDVNGNHCDTSQLMTDPSNPSGPSVCPGGGGGPGGGGATKLGRGRITDDPLFNDLGGYNNPTLRPPGDPMTGDPLFGDLGGYNNPTLRPPGDPMTGDQLFNDLGGYHNPALHLGMTVTPDTGLGNGVALGVGGFSARSIGVGVTDTAGLLAPGSVSTASRTSAGSGGISGSYDVSNFVGPNQKLVLNGAFDYTSTRTNFSVASGSINSDTYGFKGSLLYSSYRTYLVLKGGYEFGNSNEFFAADASSGSYRSDGYNVDARLGHLFMLFNSISAVAPPSRMKVKAPPRAAEGGYAIGLDLSGHLGYASDVARGFTDTAGFTFGDERIQGGAAGLRAKLFASVPRNGAVWQPYISGSVDWRFDYSHIASFPTQVALAGGDAVNFADGTTVLGAQAGLDVKAANGWTVGVNGFYARSSDTEVVGGRAYVRVPFGPTAVVARY